MQCPVCKRELTKKQLTHIGQKTCSVFCGARQKIGNHGFAKSRFYAIWNRIKRVCTDKDEPRYKYYGGKGVKVIWNSFEEFRNDMHQSYVDHVDAFGEQDTTIERIDNNGNYCKENCKWATRKEQAQNRSTSRMITYNGQTRCLKEWADIVHIPRTALWLRICRRKWSVDKALTTPLIVQKK